MQLIIAVLCVLAALGLSHNAEVEEAIVRITGVHNEDYKLVPTPGKYNTSSGPRPGVLNIHLISHTHVCLEAFACTFAISDCRGVSIINIAKRSL